MKIIHITDLHGDIEAYEKLFDAAERRNAKAILIGGDISPGFNMLGQRAFIEQYLIPRIEDFRKGHKCRVFMITGNDDFGINTDLLKRADMEGVISLLHEKVERLGDYWVAGYPYINDTPFLFKEWEKSEKEIGNDLEKLSKKSDPRKTVYLFHVPPWETHLDVLYTGEHVGSKAVKDFILKKRPYMTLHGHIHESPMMTGLIKDRVGETISLNPGNCNPVLIKLESRKVNVIE